MNSTDVANELSRITQSKYTISLATKMAKLMEKDKTGGIPAPTVTKAMEMMGSSARGNTHNALLVIHNSKVFVESLRNGKVFLSLPIQSNSTDIDFVLPEVGEMTDDDRFRRLESLSLQVLGMLQKYNLA